MVLVCALGVAAPGCQRETSIGSFHAPGPQAGFGGCRRERRLYAAGAGMVPPEAYAEIVCVGQRPVRLAKDTETR
jgi:hypothetical protein